MIKYLRVRAKEITKLINFPDNYVGITITGTINGTQINKVVNYSINEALKTDSNFFLTSCELYIKPQFFGFTSFIDGVYNLKISLNKADGYILITNCTFVDITFKCKVAQLLNTIKKENELANSEKYSTITHLLHYSLLNGSNCGCNCDELLQVFNELASLLNTVDPKILKDCGC